jgi:hypothetical protein
LAQPAMRSPGLNGTKIRNVWEVMPEGTGSVPERRSDRSHSTRYRLLMASLSRSAWNSATSKSRPVGYGLVGADLIPKVFRIERCAVFFKEG